jgi:AcrR family transcriptional regulator
MGPQDSDTSNALLDAAERVLLADGQAGATSRRIAAEAGVKQQLVYYYFRTMEDLLLAAFKRRTDRALVHLKKAGESEQPMQAIWKNLFEYADGKLAFEFQSLAKQHEGIGKEVARYVTESRRIEAAAIARQFAEAGADAGPAKPAAISFLIHCMSLFLRREAALGVTEGHDDVYELIDWVFKRVS